MPQTLALIGAATSAGAHFPGLEQGPEHFRRAGLLAKLIDAGFDVLDLGDIPTTAYEPDPTATGPRSVERVAAVARQVAARVVSARAIGARPIIIGGDCSITIGVISGLLRSGADVGLAYLDGHVDLNTPDTSDYGVLDSMVATHLLGLLDNELSRIGPRFPLLPADRVAFIGYDPAGINQGEIPILERLQTLTAPQPQIVNEPEAVATVLSALEARVDTLLVHFDVDVINFLDFPVGNFPWYRGLTLEQAGACLARLVASPKFGGLVLSEFNPDRDKQRVYARRLTEIIGDSLAGGADAWGDPQVPIGT
jgi:arginase